MTFISQYGPAELITANFVAATAVPVVIGDAQLTFDQLKVQPRFEQSIMDLVAVGAGASTAIVQPWLWDSQLKVWFKAGVHGRLDLDISDAGIALAFKDSLGATLREDYIPKGR